MYKHDDSRRGFVKRAIYVAPAIVTLAAAPAFAKDASVKIKPEKPPKTKGG